MIKLRLFALLVFLALVVVLVRYCTTSTAPPSNTTAPFAKVIKQNTRAILNSDSLNSATEKKIRMVVDSAKAADDKRCALLMKNYLTLEAQSNATKNRYLKAPTLEKCDSLVNLQGKQIDKLKLAKELAKDSRGKDSTKLASYKREIEGKNVAINQLSSNVEEAVKEIERRDNLKEPPKIYVTGSLQKVSSGFNAYLGGTLALPSGLLVGYQK